MDIYTKLRISLYAAEALAAVTGFLYWKKIRHSFWKWFPFYLLIIVAIEVITESAFHIYENYSFNIAIHDYFSIPLQFLFFFWIFYMGSVGSSNKRWPLISAVLYGISWVAEVFLFENKRLWFMSFSYTVGNLLLLVCVISFFIAYVKSEKIITYRSDMIFWVSVGLLVFYLGSFPLYGMYNTLIDKFPDLFNQYWLIAMGLNCTMYILFTLSFVWGKPR